MTLSLFQTQMGMSGIGSVTGFIGSSIDASVNRAIQAHNNVMSKLGAAQSLNVVTLREIAAQDADTRADERIQQQEIVAKGQAKVAASSAGVSGNSVDSVMQSIKSNAARAQYARQAQLDGQLVAHGQERRNINVSAALNKDITVIPNPSIASAVLGMGMDMLDLWDSHQTPEAKLAARLGKKT